MTNNRLTDERITQIYAECEERDPAIVEIRAMVAELQERRKADSEPAQPDIEMLSSALRNAPLAPSDSQGRPRVPIVPDEIPLGLTSRIINLLSSGLRDHALTQEIWNACRAAMLQAGNSPVIPEGYALVPIVPTDEMIAAAMDSDDVSFDKKDDTMFYVHHDAIWRAMLAAALQPQSAQQNIPEIIPDRWIPVSERMPEEGAYISAISRHGEYVAGQVSDGWLELHDGTLIALDQIRLWMPLPAAPQEE